MGLSNLTYKLQELFEFNVVRGSLNVSPFAEECTAEIPSVAY